MRAHLAVVLNADGHRLRIAEAIRGRMAPAARVVLVQRVPCVEPEHPTEIGQLGIDGPAEICLEARQKCLLDLACEPGSRKDRCQISVERTVGLLRRKYSRDESRRTERQRQPVRLSCTRPVDLPPRLTTRPTAVQPAR